MRKMKIGSGRSKAYRVVSIIILIILALFFLFPLYWIITGAFKPAQDIYSQLSLIHISEPTRPY